MKILVTGGSGFIGSHIVDVLVEEGHEVTNLDIKAPYRQDIRHVNGSMLDRELISSLVKDSEYIYHIGGFSNINFVKDNPVKTIELNVLSTLYFLDACEKHKTNIKRFIYASSVYAFDRMGHLYTTSKAMSERIIEDFQNLYGIPYTILRFGTVYGPRNRSADVVYLFTNIAVNGGPIVIHGDGNQRRNFIHARDLAKASVKVLNSEDAENKTLVVAHCNSISIKELADKMKEIVNPQVKIIFKQQKREQDYKGMVGDVELTQKILGWHPEISLELGIRELSTIILRADR